MFMKRMVKVEDRILKFCCKYGWQEEYILELCQIPLLQDSILCGAEHLFEIRLQTIIIEMKIYCTALAHQRNIRGNCMVALVINFDILQASASASVPFFTT